ncbi:hypothetical protein J1N35_024659 [Gossypium stocksii]|uniref:Uncharacterized protein n=1 Tax=Gossypium stocksii TaxID=47602 RepID=A0A9D3ZWY3_9ROSI|nr:hypothetical protein J1N35_024659 [Gossypium stocksii]
MRGTHSQIVSVRLTRIIVTKRSYAYITIPNEMKRALVLQRIELFDFAYNFSILSRAGDNREITCSIGGPLVKDTWPHNFVDQLGMILTGRLKETANFFYHYFVIAPHPFALPKFERDKGVRGGIQLSLTSTGPRVLTGVETNQSNEGNSSDTDSDIILCELNEANDIDALISSGRKKHKTSTGAA